MSKDYEVYFGGVDDYTIFTVDGDTSDGYHTFDELYEHRTALLAALCVTLPDYSWKSKFHDDGTMYDDMFIVGIMLPMGTVTYHCEMKYWDMFDKVDEFPKAPAWDGATSDDSIKRLSSFAKTYCRYSVCEEISW